MCPLLPFKHIDMLHDGIEKITFPAWMKMSLLLINLTVDVFYELIYKGLKVFCCYI